MPKIPSARVVSRLCVTLALSLSACVHAGQVMTKDGPTVSDREDPSSQSHQFYLLWQAAKKANEQASEKYPDDQLKGGITPEEIAANRRLLNAGMAIIYNGCNDFFIQEGDQQQGLSFSKDLTGALVPNISGALGLVPSAGIASPLVGFLGGGITAGISVASANFLFGSDNIDDVRTLTMNALSAHEGAVQAIFANSVSANEASRDNPPPKPKIDPKTGVTTGNTSNIVANFWWVTQQIADHQALCQPVKILSLAKESIKKANICAKTTASSTSGQGNSSLATQPVKSTDGQVGKRDASGTPTASVTSPMSPLPTSVRVTAEPSCDEIPDGGKNQQVKG